MDFRTRKKFSTMTNPFKEFYSMSTPVQPTYTDWSAFFKHQPEEPKPDPIGFRRGWRQLKHVTHRCPSRSSIYIGDAKSAAPA